MVTLKTIYPSSSTLPMQRLHATTETPHKFIYIAVPEQGLSLAVYLQRNAITDVQ